MPVGLGNSTHSTHAESLSSRSADRSSVVRHGHYLRKDDGKRVSRYRCLRCRRTFSSACFFPNYRQKKRSLNRDVYQLLCSAVSQRRIARLLQITRNTVVRKFLFLATLAQRERLEALEHQALSTAGAEKILHVQFDEMRSSIWSKCLPVSIPLAVSNQRRILGFRVAEIPANGPLAEISRRKYGPRKDERNEKAKELLTEIAAHLSEEVTFVTDQDPKYPGWIRTHFPRATHHREKSRRACVAGQGELKEGGFDPLFVLNHTCAMFRANVNRLLRRTWCTSKLKSRLEAHLELYVQYHNQVLLPNPSR